MRKAEIFVVGLVLLFAFVLVSLTSLVSAYSPHATILINGNADFIAPDPDGGGDVNKKRLDSGSDEKG